MLWRGSISVEFHEDSGGKVSRWTGIMYICIHHFTQVLRRCGLGTSRAAMEDERGIFISSNKWRQLGADKKISTRYLEMKVFR